MGLYESLKTSDHLERQGIWLDLDHTRLRLGRAGGKNVKYNAAMSAVLAEHKRTLEFMPDEQGRRLFNEVYANTVILDWLTKDAKGTLNEVGSEIDEGYNGIRYSRGIEGPDGKIIPFTPANVVTTLMALPDLAVMIKETAEDVNLFKEKLVKDISGN